MALAVVMLMLVWYMASAPFALAVVYRVFPAAEQPMSMAYAPCDYYANHPELPGGWAYRRYFCFCYGRSISVGDDR
ncbi:MAG: hypothetical protein U0992_20640 [Planctomycetaceae bacterium]